MEIYLDFSYLNLPFLLRCMQIRVDLINPFEVGLGEYFKCMCHEFPQNKS